MTEFELCVKAKAGDSKAYYELWKLYKAPVLSILRKAAHLDRDEVESEAYELLSHKLSIFDPTKVKVSHESFSFGYMYINGAKNRLCRLVNESKRDIVANGFEYLEESPETEEPHNVSVVDQVRAKEVFHAYSSEILAIRNLDESTSSRVKRLASTLTTFQKDVLRLRRAGYKFFEIADELNCSLSKVKDHFVKAKVVASEIFGVAYA